MTLYQDHDGSPSLPRQGEAWLPARLLPIDEAVETQQMLAQATADEPSTGDVAWLWTDDNSNYVGIYTSGLLQGWLVKLNHEEPILTPAYRSVTAFLSRLLTVAPGTAEEDDAAYDIVAIPREVPTTEDDPANDETDRALARSFRELFEGEANPDLRRLYAMCAICLTPVSDTASVVQFLSDKDMWTPEAAVVLMEIRRFGNRVEDLERLAREGTPNGDSAAMRLLVRSGTEPSKAAIARLEKDLSGQKLQMLKHWTRNRDRLQPPR